MTQITNQMLVSENNSAFRSAFSVISRHALPFMSEDAYFSDLLHDTARATILTEGERFYLLVRRMGTNVYGYPDDAIDYLPKTDGVAVLRILRGSYDVFHVKVVYVDSDRAVMRET
jgi:hypothetical protein